MNSEARHADDAVLVTATDCSPEDARTLIGFLERAFPGEVVEEKAAPARDHAGHPTVWSTTVDAGRPGARTGPVTLDGTVRVGVQGGPRAVDRVLFALSESFTVEAKGTVAGDQEREVELLLATA
ncbi:MULTISPECIES: hypothetical protein [unclassified Streptomyces]|uniref:hypothetical protein n=1 Tax=unclassified Streptomyces TaxID=2593676 RepID=UPI00109EC70C|nr:hypothetical protein [Streptomyces sp. A1136]THA50403.1 hypothetical protein E6R62_25660 [Streptomyces sp. A1136]